MNKPVIYAHNSKPYFFTFFSVQAQRRSKEHSRSTSAMSGLGDEKSELSEAVDHHMSLYSNGFPTATTGTYARHQAKKDVFIEELFYSSLILVFLNM